MKSSSSSQDDELGTVEEAVKTEQQQQNGIHTGRDANAEIKYQEQEKNAINLSEKANASDLSEKVNENSVMAKRNQGIGQDKSDIINVNKEPQSEAIFKSQAKESTTSCPSTSSSSTKPVGPKLVFKPQTREPTKQPSSAQSPGPEPVINEPQQEAISNAEERTNFSPSSATSSTAQMTATTTSVTKKKLTLQQKLMLVENKKNHGRRGDPRMNTAVAKKIENPNLTLFQALTEGGFEFPCEEHNSTGNGPVYDSNRVLLSQRKNQLSRRLRLLSRKINRMIELREQQKNGPDPYTNGPKPPPDRAFIAGRHELRTTSDESTHQLSGSIRIPFQQSQQQHLEHQQNLHQRQNPYLPRGVTTSSQHQHINRAAPNYTPSFNHEPQTGSVPPLPFAPSSSGEIVQDYLLQNQLIRAHLNRNNNMFMNQFHHQQPSHFDNMMRNNHQRHYFNSNTNTPPTIPIHSNSQFSSRPPMTRSTLVPQGPLGQSNVNAMTMPPHQHHLTRDPNNFMQPTSDNDKRLALINAGFKEEEITEELINEFHHKLLEKVQASNNMMRPPL